METATTSVLKKMLLVFLLVTGLYFAKDFLIPIAIAGILSMLFLPFCNWLEHKKLHRGIAALLCLLTLLLSLTVIIFFLGWKVNELAGDFSVIWSEMISAASRLQYYLYHTFGITRGQQSDLLISEVPAVNWIIPALAGSLFHFATHSILVVAYFFLLLFYRRHLRAFILKLIKTADLNETEMVIHQITHVSQNYLLGVAKMIVCLWILYAISFSAIGVEDAIFFAILCGLLEIVPYIGNITGTLVTVMVTAVHGASPTLLVGIVLVYCVVQFIQGWVLEPLIVGPQVKINPLFTVLSIVIGGLIWGIAGIFLAIPIIAMFKIVCNHVESLKPYGFLVGEVARIKPKRIMIAPGENQKHI